MHARTSFGFGADPGGVPPEPALGAFRQVLADHCAQFNSQQVVQLPAAASLELVRTLALSVRRSLKQIVPLTAASEPESPFAHLVCRELASRLTVQRIYLVTPDGTDSETLDGRLDADQRDALDARLVPAADDPTFPLRNTWLVDDSIVVHEDFTDDGAPAWTIDSRS